MRVAVIVLLASCAETPMVRADRWVLAGGTCGADAVFVEGDAIEVRTQTCNSATLEQPLARPLPKGTIVRADVSHTSLTGEAASARIAVSLGETVLEETFAVPAAAAIHTLRGALESDVKAGELVRFSVENHGSNSYVLHALEFTP